MGHIISILFNPPVCPEIALPIPAYLIPGIRMTIAEVFKVAYYRGVYDGMVAGVLLTLFFVPSIRKGITRGASNAISSL